MKRPAHILPVIIFSLFAGSSLWFAGNAVIADLQSEWQLTGQSVGYITAAVQLGFITGTLIFAFLALADRFSPRWVFFCCAIAGAVTNIALLIAPQSLAMLLVLRFMVGFFLAGIYPVGMKIATGWYQQGLGRALGYIVGALVLGTAFPHLLRGLGTELPWQQVVAGVSLLSACGGLAMLLFVQDGPYLPNKSTFDPRVLAKIFGAPSFRASACGYFGHMWELYSFWAFVPVWLLAYVEIKHAVLNVPMWSFLIIAAGFIGCFCGGLMAEKIGSAKVAATQLFISGLCCLLSPLFFQADVVVLIIFLLLWGIAVVGDSPQFSTLNAATAPREYVGSALAIVNSIGFLITVFSIQLVNSLWPLLGPEVIFWLLIPGPVIGLLAFKSLLGSRL